MSTDIAWCDETINVSTGCTRVAPECDNCYAMSFAHRAMRPEHEGLTKIRPKDAKRPGVDWNGVVRMHPERLLAPAAIAGRKRIFVNSMSDIFHAALPDDFIAAAHGMAALFPHHTFMFLTKRVAQAEAFHRRMKRFKQPAHECVGRLLQQPGVAPTNRDLGRVNTTWPLPNVWLGCSVGSRATVPWIGELLHVPAALHFVSFEPLLEDVGDLGTLLPTPAEQKGDKPRFGRAGHLGWAILGGESGHKHTIRPCDVKWIRRLLEQLQFAKVPTFVKQMGSRAYSFGDSWRPFIGRYSPVDLHPPEGYRLADSAGAEPSEWPQQLRVQEHPRGR